MSEPRRIAVVHDYNELIAALRARCDELGATRESLDAVSGMQSGYAGKLLAPVPIRGLGRTSLGPILQALGLMIVVVEDEEMLRRIAARIRGRSPIRPHASETMLPKRKRKRRGFVGREASLILNARRAIMLSYAERRRIAKGAARARWRKARRVSPAAKAYRGTPRAPADSRSRPPSAPRAAATLRPAAQSLTE